MKIDTPTTTTPNPVNSKPITPRKPKSNKFKNFLLTFFIIEHIVVMLILLIPVFFMIRAYAFSDFGKLNEKATNFTPKNQDKIIGDYTGKYLPYAYSFLQSKEEHPTFDFEFAEEDINSMIYDMKIDYIERFYVSLADDNIIYIWVKTTKIPYPLMFKANFNYNFESKLFEVKFLDWQVGPLSFPAELLEFIENIINRDAWENISSMTSDYPVDIISIQTSNESFKATVQVSDKVKLMEIILKSLFKDEFDESEIDLHELLSRESKELPANLPSPIPANY